MKGTCERFSPGAYLLFVLALAAAMLLCVCVGSVNIPIGDILTTVWNTLWRLEVPVGIAKNIIEK